MKVSQIYAGLWIPSDEWPISNAFEASQGARLVFHFKQTIAGVWKNLMPCGQGARDGAHPSQSATNQSRINRGSVIDRSSSAWQELGVGRAMIAPGIWKLLSTQGFLEKCSAFLLPQKTLACSKASEYQERSSSYPTHS